MARRQQDFCFTASTRMEFQPEHFQQAAGLILYYHATKFHYLFLTRGRSDRPPSARHVVRDGCRRQLQRPDSAAGGDGEYRASHGCGFRAADFFLSPAGSSRGQSCRRFSTRALCPTKPARPRCRTSPAPSSASAARTARERDGPPISTTSSTKSAITANRSVRTCPQSRDPFAPLIFKQQKSLHFQPEKLCGVSGRFEFAAIRHVLWLARIRFG